MAKKKSSGDDKAIANLQAVPGVGKSTAKKLAESGIRTANQLSKASMKKLLAAGLTSGMATKLVAAAAKSTGKKVAAKKAAPKKAAPKKAGAKKATNAPAEAKKSPFGSFSFGAKKEAAPPPPPPPKPAFSFGGGAKKAAPARKSSSAPAAEQFNADSDSEDEKTKDLAEKSDVKAADPSGGAKPSFLAV